MKPSLPFVSVLVPARNEEASIRQCLGSLLAQDYPSARYEIIIADGESTDRTRSIADEVIGQNPSRDIRIVRNPGKSAPSGLNAAIPVSRGEIVVRLDAHSYAPRNFVSGLVDALMADPDAVCAGPVLDTVGTGAWGRAIARAQSDPVGGGPARFRFGGPVSTDVDTVAFGAYRRWIFDRFGLFDTTLVRNQDDEFNGRLRAAGHRIVLVPHVVVRYYCRTTIRALYRQYRDYGYYKPLVAVRLGRPATVRQLLPPAFAVVLPASLAISVKRRFRTAAMLLPVIYCMALVTRGVVQVRRDAGRFAVACATMHLSYGCGYLAGLVSVVRLRDRRSWRQVRAEVRQDVR